MSEPAGFSTSSILEALQKIHHGKLTGILSFPYLDDLAAFSFRAGEFVALDSQTGRKYLAPFLAERGAGVAQPLGGDTGIIALAELKAVPDALAEFVGRVFNLLADPSVGVLLNFQPKPEEALGVTGPGLPVATLVLQFFDKWLDARLLTTMLPDPAVLIRVTPDHLQRIRTLALTPRQGFILARLQDGLRVRDFINSCGMPEEQVLRDVMTFAFFEILSLGTPAPKAAAPPPLRRPPEARPGTPPPPAVAAPAPTPVAAEGETVPAELMAQVQDLSIVLEKGNHYEILDVSYHAETEEIKRRFVELTRNLHPDKFQQYGNPMLQSQVDAIFTKITEAYEVLKDPLRRSAYNEQTGLDKAPLQKPAAPPPPGPDDKKGGKTYAYEDPEHKAKQHYVHGKEALKNQKFHDAVEHFRESVRLMPDVAEYQFFLGRTLSMNPQRVKEAEERLKRALELKPDRVELLLELGRFYVRVNLRLRAKVFYERVLKIDPQNKEARQALGLKTKEPMNLKNLLKLDLKDLLKPKKDE